MGVARIDESVFIADGVQISGGEEIEIGAEVNLWYNTVIRSGEQPVRIGARTNVQDGCVIHTSARGGTEIGEDVTIGHMALIHGCTIGSRTLIGMGSIVMDGAVIGNDCILGAGSLVTQDTEIPDGVLAFGRPAKVIRPLREEEKAALPREAEAYLETARKERAARKAR